MSTVAFAVVMGHIHLDFLTSDNEIYIKKTEAKQLQAVQVQISFHEPHTAFDIGIPLRASE